MDNKVKVRIHIVDYRSESTTFNPKLHGMNFSAGGQIRVNKTPDAYTVVFKEDEFMNVDTIEFTSTLINLLTKNLPNTLFEMSVIYHTDSKRVDLVFMKVNKFATLLKKISDTGKVENVIFEGANVPVGTFGVDLVNQDDSDDDEDFDEDEDDDIIDPFGFLTETKKGKKKKSKEYYGRSRVWKDAKNPKRDINRHGVLISSDKDDLRRDEKIIKEFLKDFLPGDAGWKKEFRKELAKRWLDVYAISKKKLKTLEKEHRGHRQQKRINKGINTGLNFMNRMISRPLDSWSDPNK